MTRMKTVTPGDLQVLDLSLTAHSTIHWFILSLTTQSQSDFLVKTEAHTPAHGLWAASLQA